MAPFFDQPGSTAGPYSTPAQPGILSRILQGVNVAMKLGDFYQDWQSKTQARENAGIQGVTNRVALARAIAGPDADIAATPELMRGAEGIWPKVTAGARESMGEGVIGGIAPTTGEAVPGGMATRLGSPELAQKQATYEQGMTALPEVGGPMPIMAQPKKVAIIGRGGMVKGVSLPPGTSQVIQEKISPEFGVWDGDTFIPTPGRPTLARPSQEEIQARQIAVKQATPGGKAGGGGAGGRTGGGLTKPQLDWQTFMETKKLYESEHPGETYTIVDHTRAMRTRPDSVSETTQPSRGEKITKKTYNFPKKPGKPGSRDAALDAIGTYKGSMPAPAGQENLTPIGRTPDGRIVYKDASGKTGTKD